MAFEIAIVTAFAGLILASFFGRQYYRRRDRKDLTFTVFGILCTLRFINLYFMIPELLPGADTTHLAIHRAFEWVVGLLVLLLGLEMIHANVLARVDKANPFIRRLTYVVPSIVLPALILMLPFYDGEMVRRIALFSMMPITFGVLIYYLFLIWNNPLKALKPEYARGSKIVIVGYLTLTFGDAIFAGVLNIYEISLGLDTVALLLIACGGIVQTTTTFAGLYTHLNSRILIVNRDMGVEVTNLGDIEYSDSIPNKSMRIANEIVSMFRSSISKAFSNGEEFIIPYVTIDELGQDKLYQIDIIPHQLDLSGRPLTLLLIINDVTQSIKEKENERLNELLDYVITERNRAELYLDLLTHDMSNLLQGILLGFETVQDELGSIHNLDGVLELTYSQLDKAMNLLKDVDAIAEVESSPIELVPIELCSTLRNTFIEVQNKKPPNSVMYQLDLPGDDVFVMADRLIEECIRSIIDFIIENDDNEVRYLEAVLRQSSSEGLATILIRGFSGGIVDYLKDHIFDWEIRSGKPSAGIGLPLAREIVNRYDGTVRVEDRIQGDYSEGPVFVIEIPITEHTTIEHHQ